MKKTALLLTCIGLIPMAAIAAPLYSLDMTSDNTGDFNQRVQIGTIGSNNSSALNLSFQTNQYLVQGRYGTGVGLSLNQGGASGVYSGDKW